MENFCGNCGSRLEHEDLFCGNCGSPVKHSASQGTPADAAVPPPEPPLPGAQPKDAPKTPLKSPVKRRYGLFVLIIGILIVFAYVGLKLLGDAISPGHIQALALSPDGKRLVSKAFDGRLQTWDLESRTSTGKTPWHGTIKAAAWSHDGQALALANERQITLFSTFAAGLSKKSSWTVGTNDTIALCLAPDETTLYGLTTGFGISVWDINRKDRSGGLPDIPGKNLRCANCILNLHRIEAVYE